MTNNTLYKFQWSEEIARGLERGTHQLMRDKASGLPLAVATNESGIQGLARLIPIEPSFPSPIPSLINPILGGANLLATGFTILQNYKLGKKIDAGFAKTFEKLEQLDESMRNGFSCVHQHLSTNQEALVAHISESKVLTMINITLAQELHQNLEQGLNNIYTQLEELKHGQKWIVDSISEKIDALHTKIQNHEFRKAAITFNRLQEEFYSEVEEGDISVKSNILDDIRSRLSNDIIPTVTSLLLSSQEFIASPFHVACLLLLSQAYNLLGFIESHLQRSKKSRKTYQEGFHKIQGNIERILTKNTSEYDFYMNCLPAVQLLLPACDTLRMGCFLATNLDELELVEIAPAKISHRYILPIDISRFPTLSGSGNSQAYKYNDTLQGQNILNNETHRRIYKQRISSEREYILEDEEVFEYLGIPSTIQKTMISGSESREITNAIKPWLDPANRSAITTILLEVLGKSTPERDAQLLENARKYLECLTNSTWSLEDLNNLPRHNIILFSARWDVSLMEQLRKITLEELPTSKETDAQNTTDKLKREKEHLIQQQKEIASKLEKALVEKEDCDQRLYQLKIEVDKNVRIAEDHYSKIWRLVDITEKSWGQDINTPILTALKNIRKAFDIGK